MRYFRHRTNNQNGYFEKHKSNHFNGVEYSAELYHFKISATSMNCIFFLRREIGSLQIVLNGFIFPKLEHNIFWNRCMPLTCDLSLVTTKLKKHQSEHENTRVHMYVDQNYG